MTLHDVHAPLHTVTSVSSWLLFRRQSAVSMSFEDVQELVFTSSYLSSGQLLLQWLVLRLASSLTTSPNSAWRFLSTMSVMFGRPVVSAMSTFFKRSCSLGGIIKLADLRENAVWYKNSLSFLTYRLIAIVARVQRKQRVKFTAAAAAKRHVPECSPTQNVINHHFPCTTRKHVHFFLLLLTVYLSFTFTQYLSVDSTDRLTICISCIIITKAGFLTNPPIDIS